MVHGRPKPGAWRVYDFYNACHGLSGGSVVCKMKTSFDVLPVNGKGDFREESELGFEGSDVVVVEEKAVKMEGADEGNDIVVRAYPRSRRLHQIRLHCQYLGI